MASELIFWPIEELMRLMLGSPAVPLPLDCLGKEVLGTAKCATAVVPPPTHLVQERSRDTTPWSSHGQANFQCLPYPGLHAESGIQYHGEGTAVHSSWLSRAMGLSSRDIGQCVKFEL